MKRKQFEVCVEAFKRKKGSCVVYTTTYDEKKGRKEEKYLHQMAGEKEVMTVGLIMKTSRQTGSARVMFSNKIFSHSHV